MAYQAIIIGAGHNGLVCAAYLAARGRRVLVLESAEKAGGLAASREFHPGYHAPVAHEVRHFPEKIVRELGLKASGLPDSTGATPFLALKRDGNPVVISEGGLEGVSPADNEAFGEFQREMRKFAKALEPFWLKTIPRARPGGMGDLLTFGQIGLKLRMLGREDLREFLRVAALPARDLVDERFDDASLKAALCWDGLLGGRMAPRSPNHAVLPMLYRLSGGWKGKPGALIQALETAAKKAGAEVRTGTAVERILARPGGEGLLARGVRLATGEEIEAERVVSSADPQTTFFRLLGARHLEIEFANRIRRLRCDGLVAKLHLALDGPPDWKGDFDGSERLLTAADMDEIEVAFDDAKYGACPRRPVMEISLPSLASPELAEAGGQVLSAQIMYVPYRRKGGWDESARRDLLQSSIDVIEEFAPGIQGRIRHAELLTPLDLERRFGVTGGHWHQTEFALDQALMMRPTYDAAQYRTPLTGLYLCGAGCHPGGDLTGMPGHNAAREILRESDS